MPINSNEAISNHLLFPDCRIWFWFCHSSPSTMVIAMLPLIIWQAMHIEHAAFLASIVHQCHGVSSYHLKAGDGARGYRNSGNARPSAALNAMPDTAVGPDTFCPAAASCALAENRRITNSVAAKISVSACCPGIAIFLRFANPTQPARWGPTPIIADRVMDGEAADIIPWVGLI